LRQSAADFIQFALRLYSRPGLMPVCLRLQNEAGLDVNCLLAAAWAARLGYELDAEAWQALHHRAQPMRELATLPIRELRRKISREVKLAEELRAGIKRMLLYAELRSEQAEERALHEAMLAHGRKVEPGAALLRRNLATLTGADTSEFATLVVGTGLIEEA
jgi:uncharacterized protein (TIGR02444 family)